MENTVSFGFRPNEEELVGIHLRRRLEGNASYVHEFISEVDVCSFDPWNLRFQSKYKSTDPMWYFFSPIKNKYSSGDQQNRTTNSGKWKVNSRFTDVIDKWGVPSGVPGITGAKRVLSFIDGRYPGKTNSDWMIHEYHCTIVPEHQRTHVICRLHYKGDDPSILEAFAIGPDPALVPNMTSSEGSVVVNQSFQGNSGSYNTYPGNDSAHHPQQFNDNSFNMQLDPQGNLGSFNIFPEYDDSAYLGQDFGVNFDMLQSEALNHLLEANDDQLVSENELQMFMEQNFGFVEDGRTHMQENCSAYRPKKTETGVIEDDSSVTETGSMIFEDTSSSTDSVGSSNESNHTPEDDIPSLIKKVKITEKSECEWKMAEDSMKKRPSTKMVKQSWIVMEKISQRNSKWNYVMNMIIGFVVFISIIGWIIMVG